MIDIRIIGSKWAGQPSDTIADLLSRLSEYALDPTFEQYGNFVSTIEKGHVCAGKIHIWGNFDELSYVFDVTADHEAEVTELIAAIRANQRTDAYKAAKRERAQMEAQRLAEAERRQRADRDERRRLRSYE